MIEDLERLWKRGNEAVTAFRSADEAITVTLLDRPDVRNAINAHIARGLNAVNIILYESLGGGASESLRTDVQGQTYTNTE